MKGKSDFEAQQELIAKHLDLGRRLNEAEGKISLLTRRIHNLEKVRGVKAETAQAFRARVLSALGSKG